MRIVGLARIGGLSLVLIVSALALSADYPPTCDCFYCSEMPDNTCSTRNPWEFAVWSCEEWLAQSDCGQTCETVTDCQGDADCFGGLCTSTGICLCP